MKAIAQKHGKTPAQIALRQQVQRSIVVIPKSVHKERMKQNLNIFDFALEQAQRLGCKAVRLDTWEGNHPAASLYQHMGFRLAGSAPMCLQGLIQEQQIYLECEVKQYDPTEQ